MDKREILFDGDEVVKIEGEIDLSKYRFKRKELNIAEFLELLEKYPSLGFNAYQSLYAALKMFGKTQPENPFKPERPRWLDDPVKGLIDEPGVGPVYGVEQEVKQIMNYLRGASIDTDIRGRLVVLVGDVGTGKTNVIKLMEKALMAFRSLPEGEVYTVKFDLKKLYSDLRKRGEETESQEILERLKSLEEDLMEKFGGLKEILCPAHEVPTNIILSLEREGLIENRNLEKRIEKINSKLKYQWQKLELRGLICPSCEYVISSLQELKEKYSDVFNFSEKYMEENLIKIVNLKPVGSGTLVKSQKIEPPDERSSKRVDLIEGSVNMGRMISFGGKRNHPLVLNFGLAGMIDAPSGQRAIIHFSEIFKADKEFIRSLLDLVQNKMLTIGGGLYDVYTDAVFFGTSNLEETRKILEYEIAKTIRSRSIIVPFGNLKVADDATKVFKERIFKNVDYHIPPHFLERLLAFIYVMSTLTEPKVGRLTLAEKALIYNGEYPHGREEEIEQLRKELKREAEALDIDKIVEGMRIGISMRVIENLKLELGYLLRELYTRLKEKHEPKPCIALLEREDGVKVFMEDFVKKCSDINDETRKRVLEKVIPTLFDYNEFHGFFYTSVAKDVHLALLGSEHILSTAATYISMITAMVKRKSRYRSLEGYEQPIDKEFVESIERELKVGDRDAYREALVYAFIERVRERKRIYEEEGKRKEGKEIYLEVVKSLLEQKRSFRDAIESYVIRNYLSQKARDATSVYSPQNKPLVEELKKMGYCEYCAEWAIRIASNLRPKYKSK